MFCKLCSTKVYDGFNLADGTIVHKSCINSLQEKESKIKREIIDLQIEFSHNEREIKRRDGIAFKVISIFSKPKVESPDIEIEILNLRKKIEQSMQSLIPIQTRLASLYDYFLSYPPDWDKRKTDVIRRDGERCSRCGNYRHLHLHHITPLSRGGTNKISNLELLCEKCHSKKHGGRDFSGDFHNTSESTFSKRVASLRLAIQQGRRVQFEYKKKSEKSFKTRTIKPIELINVPHREEDGSTLCVSGYCDLRKANRTFALKRMRGLKII